MDKLVNKDITKNFLPEDLFLVTDEYIKIQQNCIKVLEDSKEVRLDEAKEVGVEILNSLGKLNELYLKKVQSENKSVDTRRNYF